MIRKNLPSFIFLLFCMTFLTSGLRLDAMTESRYDVIQSTATGTGTYFPLTGYYFGPGTGPELGNLFYNGTMELTPVGDPLEGKFKFKNKGRGTADEIFHETIYEDGSTISTRFRGTVQLIPYVDSSGNMTDKFTANWEGKWRVVKGTGQFLGARGNFDVTAVNEPFNPQTDPVWQFSWSWTGKLKIPKRRFAPKCFTFQLETGGFGVFDPANLGLGDPNVYPFPVVIGDGSGTGVYDGTPTGNEFRLNGHLVGNGFDRHFGTAQSISPGVFIPSAGVIRYPGVSGENPDGSGRKIHVMKTWLGEIWFHNTYYFELDPAAGTAGTIVANADFRVLGGTWLFKYARGSVFVRVFSDLADFNPGNPATGIPPSAPFRYDFHGYLEYCR